MEDEINGTSREERTGESLSEHQEVMSCMWTKDVLGELAVSDARLIRGLRHEHSSPIPGEDGTRDVDFARQGVQVVGPDAV